MQRRPRCSDRVVKSQKRTFPMRPGNANGRGKKYTRSTTSGPKSAETPRAHGNPHTHLNEYTIFVIYFQCSCNCRTAYRSIISACQLYTRSLILFIVYAAMHSLAHIILKAKQPPASTLKTWAGPMISNGRAMPTRAGRGDPSTAPRPLYMPAAPHRPGTLGD